MNPEADALENEAVRLAELGENKAALEIIRRMEATFPESAPDAAHIEACLLVRLGRRDDALARLERALDRGDLWRPRRLDDPDLAPLRAAPRFEAVVAGARALAAGRRVQPQLLTALPDRANAPLLLAFHGAASTAAPDFERWRGATELGYAVAALQSSQPAGAGAYCWDDAAWANQDVRWALARLPPRGRVVLAGFSQGARLALRLALDGALVQAGAAVLVAPSLVDPLPPAARRLRVAIVAGADDPYLRRSQPALDALRERGHEVTLDTIPGLGHAFPPDFAARLPHLLARATRLA